MNLVRDRARAVSHQSTALHQSTSLGPWDSSVALATSPGRHMLDTHVSCSSASFDIPYQSQVWLNTPNGGQADAVHITAPSTTTELAVTVIASPTSGNWWADTAINALTQAVTDDNTHTRAICPTTPTATVTRIPGVFDTEIHVTHHLDHTGELTARDFAILGRSGPGWTVKITAYGVDVTDADLQIAYHIMASMIIYRPVGPYAPGTPFPMGIIR